MKYDALGNEVIIGNAYGYSVDSSGITTSTVGIATNETKTGVTLEVVKSLQGLWSDKPKNHKVDKKKVTVKAMKLFPVNLELLEK
ncbi:MAG: hypothetical protein WC979_02235 [Candidatus Pacearchaeota archaeon]|jgi:hypothetical protein|nr:hypothetical protein [Clostridia bacterium]